MNYSENGNYPAIDLVDYKNKTAFQVTATSDLQKVKDSITKFYNHEIYQEIETLYLYILTERQETYSKTSIQSLIEAESKKHKEFKLTFDQKKNVIDKRGLFKTFYQTTPIELLASVADYLKKNFDKLVLKEELSEYYDKLKDLFYEVVFEDESGMTLKDIYVDPSFAIYEKHVLNPSKMTMTENHPGFLKSKYTSSLNFFLYHFLIGSKNKRLSLAESRCVILLGYPGQGKTSCLKKLLNHYLRDEAINKKDIFYFKLKNIRQGKLLAESPINVLHEEACNESGLDLNKTNFKKSILLLDGLDELFMKENMKLDDIEKICKEISREVERFSDMFVIVTSRYGYVDLHKLQKENCIVAQIGLFDVNAQIDWAERYKKFHPDAWITKDKIVEFNDQKNQNYAYLRELISQPILLQIISSLNAQVESNSTRAQIYSRLFTELIERKYSWDGQLENFSNLNRDDLRFLVQELAFLINKSGNGYITEKELLNTGTISQYLSKFPNKDFSNNIKGILISFYFREHKDATTQEETALEFLHKSLQEYMTAEKVDRTMFETFLDTNKKGIYILNSYETGLEQLNDLFAYQAISWEVKGYIVELIENHKKEEREELSERLSLFIQDFVSPDFLAEYNLKQKHPIEMSLQTFIVYWLYLTRSDMTRNYLREQEVRERVLDYIVLSDNSKYVRSHLDYFCTQDFSDTRISTLTIFESLIANCNFTDCDFDNFSVYESELRNCKFDNSENFKVEFIGCHIADTTFENCDFDLYEFNNVTFENVVFRGSYFDSTSFKNCLFKKMKKGSFDKMRLTKDAIKTFFGFKHKIDLTRSFFYDSDHSQLPITEELLRRIIQD